MMDLNALKNRCLRAQRRGWIISSAARLVSDLEKKLGGKLALPRRVIRNSPAHLVALIDAVQAGVPAEAPVPVVDALEPVELADESEPEEVEEVELAGEPEPEEVELADEPELEEVELTDEPEPEEGVEVELTDEPELEEGEEVEVLSYEEMTYHQLLDEARDRNLPGRSSKTKAELLEMLEQDDEA